MQGEQHTYNGAMWSSHVHILVQHLFTATHRFISQLLVALYNFIITRYTTNDCTQDMQYLLIIKVAPIWFLTDYPISDISVPIPIRYSGISLTLAHSVRYAIYAFLKRRLAQRCCNFCRSCCLLCLNVSFERCAYLST